MDEITKYFPRDHSQAQPEVVLIMELGGHSACNEDHPPPGEHGKLKKKEEIY